MNEFFHVYYFLNFMKTPFIVLLLAYAAFLLTPTYTISDCMSKMCKQQVIDCSQQESCVEIINHCAFNCADPVTQLADWQCMGNCAGPKENQNANKLIACGKEKCPDGISGLHDLHLLQKQ